MLHRVALVRTGVSEERKFSITRVTRIGELRTTLAVISNRHMLRRNSIVKNAVFWDVTPCGWRHIPEDGILHSHRRENIKPDIALTGWTL
jgi:hypothetical protein